MQFCRKLGAIPTQERCCNNGAVSHEPSEIGSVTGIDYSGKARGLAMKFKSEYSDITWVHLLFELKRYQKDKKAVLGQSCSAYANIFYNANYRMNLLRVHAVFIFYEKGVSV